MNGVTVAVITGSAGLIGSEAARHFSATGLDVIGIDNDLRASFFGPAASTAANQASLVADLGSGYRHEHVDVRDREAIASIFARAGRSVALVVHAAAQPSHDWAASDPFTDFDVNATGTLNVLEAVRTHSPDAVVIHLSTNKVYGDAPNKLPLAEADTRVDLEPDHPWFDGVPEDMPVDRALHSLFGASKVAADVLVQEYGRSFGIRTACFRCGTVTGPRQAAAEAHGFLAYVMRCAMTGTEYVVHGYGGKQVRDALHAADLVAALDEFFASPSCGAVYNLGGGRTSNLSVLEALDLAGDITGRPVRWRYDERARPGDHRWWITSNARFRTDHPAWDVRADAETIMREIHDHNAGLWVR